MDIDEEDLKDALLDDTTDALDGLKFVLTGEFQLISRDKLTELINNKGGRITTAVSGKTDYLITGYKLEDGREVT